MVRRHPQGQKTEAKIGALCLRAKVSNFEGGKICFHCGCRRVVGSSERGQRQGLGVINPKVFFNDFVCRAYGEFLKDPASEYRAKQAVTEANNMAERVWHWFRDSDDSKVCYAEGPTKYREGLATNVCPDFQLVWDIADGHKHVTLNRRWFRLVTSANQTEARSGGFDPAAFGESFDTPRIVITLDDGTERLLAEVLAQVMAMWEDIVTKQL